jgi:hypothetical protein
MQATLNPVFMSDKAYNEIVDAVRATYKDACVLYIDRIVNPWLAERYKAYCEKLRVAGVDVNEQRLFHGTKANLIETIANEGYKASKNTRAAFGPGTYFSPQGSMSAGYTAANSVEESYMFVNRVALGRNVVSGAGGYAKGTADSGGNGSTIYVVQEDAAALPEFVVCFHANAPK